MTNTELYALCLELWSLPEMGGPRPETVWKPIGAPDSFRAPIDLWHVSLHAIRKIAPLIAARVREDERSWPPSPYQIFKDGNMWCAVGPDFINLQESIAGFGITPTVAMGELLIAETDAAIRARQAADRPA